MDPEKLTPTHLISFLPRLLSGFVKREFLFIVLGLHLQFVTLTSFAQITKLLDFGSSANGRYPYTALISDGTFLYGMTSDGGTNNLGTIFKIKPDGTGFAKLLDFNGTTNGSNPYGSLIFDGIYLYGMTNGGSASQGNIFKIKPDGTGFTTVLDFNYFVTGAYPNGSLISDGTFLYGMTTQGGSKFYGTIFKIKPDGTGYAKLLEFDRTASGGNPQGSLILDGTFLYGMTSLGGVNDFGTVFKIKPDGTGFTGLLDFNGSASGSSPYGSLISDGTFLYGLTQGGGSNNFGTIFKILPDGTSFTKLLNFSSTLGGTPKGSLISDGTFLYGMTTQGASKSFGAIFKIKPDGTGFAKLLDNDGGTNGLNPEGTLLMDGASLYGVKSSGGPGALGTIFKINPDGSGYNKLFNFEISGNSPSGSLVSDGTFHYGMTSLGGLNNYGTIFKVMPDGTGFAKLLDLDGTTNGSRPYGSLMFDGTFLYGMTSQGGSDDAGTIFKIKPDGTGYVKLLDFDYDTSGGYPNGSLIIDGTSLYGMTTFGGSNDYGTVFKINTDGTGFVKLLDFNFINNGGYPNGSLISDGTFLYGTTYQGGSIGFGTIFKIRPDGSGFAKLLDFAGSNGSAPFGSLISDGTFFYGMTTSGGVTGDGTIFKIKSDGTGFATLIDFDGGTGSSPYGSLILDGTFLYGLTFGGGGPGLGTIFKIKADGTSFAKLRDFNDGSHPKGSLISDGTFLYGMTTSGGANGLGTLFKSSTVPSMSISNFTPTEGVAGTFVTINGTEFDPTPANNIVKFNNTIAIVTSGTATTLTVFVPAGATSGPISVTAGSTVTSLTDFAVTTVAVMFNGIVRNCNVSFVQSGADNDVTETFLPVNPSDKVKVSFSSFSVGDLLRVYDGPTIASPLLATLSGTTLPADIIASGPGGELTFLFSWLHDTSTWEATISCQPAPGPAIKIDSQPSDFTTCAGGLATFSTSASGTSNITYQWQYSSDGVQPYTDIASGAAYLNATTATLSVNTVANFGAGRYRCRINGDLAAEVFTNDKGLFVNPVPVPPKTVNSSPTCGPASVVLKALGGTNGQYVWYDVATAGTPIVGQSSSTYTTPTVSRGTSYWVSINNGFCESTRTEVFADVKTCNAPTIAPTVSTTFIEGIVTIDLAELIADIDNNLDTSTLQIIVQPGSGAAASLSGLTLTIDYSGFNYVVTEVVTLTICDLTGLCTTRQVAIEFGDNINVYNAVSPNGDGKNEFLFLQYIEQIPNKQQNQVRIYNRWGDEVFSVSNYNNHDRVFAGSNNDGNKLPAGTYFYKITFGSGEKPRTGYLELRP